MFSYKDIGKNVLLHDGSIASIMTVINENGNVVTIYGRINDNIHKWDQAGNSDNINLNIVAVWEEK